MRILIIAMGRSGGYNLGKWLSTELSCPFYHEPKINNLEERGVNIVTKYVITEWEVQKEKPNGNYDKIIGLIREGDRDTAISQIWAEQNNEWRNPYVVNEEWLTANEGLINEYVEWVKSKRESVKSIEGIELIVSYEGIYETGNDIKPLIDYIGIKSTKYTHLLDKGNKHRDRGLHKRKLI